MSGALDALIVCGGGYVSGKEIMALTLACGLQARGYRVHVVRSTWNDGDFSRRLSQAQIDHSQLRLGFISATLNADCMRMTGEQVLHWPMLLWRYRRLLNELRPRKVVHTNWHHVLLLDPFLSERRDILWVHEVMPETKQYKVFFSRAARRLQTFVAVSRAVADALIRIGVPAGKVCVIHNGVPPIECAAAELEAPRSTVEIGIAGQVGAWKGHGDLIEAFALLADKHRTLRLRIFGREDGAFAAQLKARVRELGLTQRVHWAGFVNDRAEIYRNIDICAVPSRSHEPLATSAIEAGWYGIPVVATTQGGFREIVEHGVTGLLVPPAAPAQLAAAIDSLVGDARLRRAMGSRARRRMQESFSEARFVGDFTSVVFGLAQNA